MLFIQFAQPIGFLAPFNLMERVLDLAQLLLHVRDARLEVVRICTPRLGESLKGSTYAGDLRPLLA